MEAGLARVRAEGVQRDRKLEWLHQGQAVLAERGGVVGNDALVRRIAALQAENAALQQRLARARAASTRSVQTPTALRPDRRCSR